jgi:hypothetical protein
MSLPNSDDSIRANAQASANDADAPLVLKGATDEDDQLQARLTKTHQAYEQIAQSALADLEQRRQNLQVSIEQLERKRDRIQAEIGQSFAGSSQEIAIRLQGFKDYLVGSLQDLVAVAEEMELPKPMAPQRSIVVETAPVIEPAPATPDPPQFREPAYKSNARRVRELLGLYQNSPDYYGEPWQMRRALEQIHVDRAQEWFLEQGGRGAVKGGGRSQNVLIGSAAISILRDLYGNQLRVLISANTPERLGEWRRGLQDCLGLMRTDFGPSGGIILFEEPEPLAMKAERIVAEGDIPFVILDDSDGLVSLALLKYQLWLAFAPEFIQYNTDYRY